MTSLLRCLRSAGVLTSFLVLTTAAATSIGSAQDTIGTGNGSDGALVVAGTQTINVYTAITSAAAPGATTLSVGSAAGFAAGDAVLLWQVKDPDGFTLGDQTEIVLGTDTNAGSYELIRIDSIAGLDITFETPVQRTYDASGAQMVRVPEYTTVSVPDGATLTGTAWDGATGGVLAFVATGAVTVDGTVSMNGRGFRRGDKSQDRCGANNNCTAATTRRRRAT
jgi:hypothetical protein